jgi:hypothetical protein
MRNKFLSLASVIAGLLSVAVPADAVLKHYNLTWTTISDFNTTNPSPNKYPPGAGGGISTDTTIIDDTNNGNPVLKKLVLTSEVQLTSDLPGLSGFLYLSRIIQESIPKKASFTGTGDTDTSIAWGLVTGWTITGGAWCHSFPSYICSFSVGSDLATVDPPLLSPLYDLGTWTFHGTGFTSVPFVHQIAPPASASVGNAAYHLKGRLSAGLVPAIPLLGVALLGASLLFAGARLSRKR